MMYTHIMAQECVCAHHPILMVIHVVRLIERLFSLCSSPCSFPCVSPTLCSSLPTSTCTLFFHMPPPTEESGTPGRIHTSLRLSNVLNNFHYSETSAMIFQDEPSDIDTDPSYLCDAELDDETIGKALSSPLFIQERQEPADRRQAYHSYEESLLPAQSFCVCHSRTGT